MFCLQTTGLKACLLLVDRYVKGVFAHATTGRGTSIVSNSQVSSDKLLTTLQF